MNSHYTLVVVNVAGVLAHCNTIYYAFTMEKSPQSQEPSCCCTDSRVMITIEIKLDLPLGRYPPETTTQAN